MSDKWLIFGGWGIGPEILSPLFENGSYADVNGAMPQLLNGDRLPPDWAAIAERVFEKELGEADCIAGWSTGAIVACGLAMRVMPRKLVLLSATPSFCRREGFKYGWKASALLAMRQRIAEPHNTVVQDFLVASRLSSYARESPRYGADELLAGLRFLEQVNLIPMLAKLKSDSLVLHGSEDAIIPSVAGAFLAESIGAAFKALKGGHAFFTGPAQNDIKHRIGGMPDFNRSTKE
jgi:pimeloyl-ACP methyl ester carboxylesterase